MSHSASRLWTANNVQGNNDSLLQIHSKAPLICKEARRVKINKSGKLPSVSILKYAVVLLELGCHFLHRTSHACSPFDVGVLTHVPAPPPLLYIRKINFFTWTLTACFASLPLSDAPPRTGRKSLSLCSSLKAVIFIFFPSLAQRQADKEGDQT